jgi:predicted lactoylglutathione lyase
VNGALESGDNVSNADTPMSSAGGSGLLDVRHPDRLEARMTDPAHPGRTLFVSMPVENVERSKAFFAKLGFDYNPLFSDETAACMPIGEHAFVMLLSSEKFAEFSKLPITDPATHALALYSFSVSSRDEVDAVSAAALAAGATEADGAEDYGFMYTRSFFDLDGHGWQVMWMDPAAAEQSPELSAA